MPYIQREFRFEHFKERSMEEYERILNPDPEHWKVIKMMKNGLFVELGLKNKEDGYQFARGREEVEVLGEFHRRLNNLKCQDRFEAVQEFIKTGKLPMGYNTEGELMGGLSPSDLERLTKWERVNGRLMRKLDIQSTPMRGERMSVTRAQTREIASARKTRSEDPREIRHNNLLRLTLKSSRRKLFTP